MKSLLAASMLLIFANAALAAGSDPQTAAKAFYDIYLQEHPLGVPNAELRAKFDPTLSPTLITLLKKADSAEDEYAKKTKNEYPPLVEGDLFTSNFEGVTSFTIGSCQQQEKTASCTVDLTYADDAPREPQATAPEPVKWQDTVFLVSTPDGWKVDDIAYGATWDFGNHGKLKDILVATLRSAKGAN